MRAEIIAIGDELTSGQRLDTNSQWIATELGKLGVRVAFHTTVGDLLSENLDVFRTAAGRANLIIVSGGLGPTADDLTREVIAETFQRPLEFRDEAMAHIEKLFASRNRPMPERNRVQAMFPQGSRLIANRFGTAPGIDLTISTGGDGCRIFALPGVPAEMHEMFSEVVVPRLIEELGVGQQQWFYKNLRLFGLGESDVEALIPDLIARQRDPIVGITVSKATINLRIAALATDQASADAKMQATVDEIERHLGEYIFGEELDELWDVALKELSNRQETLTILEHGCSCVLGPNFIMSQDHHLYRVVSYHNWQAATYEQGEIDALSECTDWAIVFGPVPHIDPNQPPDGEVIIRVLYRGDRVAHERRPVTGHPELALARIGKVATKILWEAIKASSI